VRIEEAIKGLQYELKEAEGDGALDAVVYFRLGIEALKRVRECRQADHLIAEDYLPGETTEAERR